MQLVEEPVDIEEGGGELIENERRTVEIEERSLYSTRYFVSFEPHQEWNCKVECWGFWQVVLQSQN